MNRRLRSVLGASFLISALPGCANDTRQTDAVDGSGGSHVGGGPMGSGGSIGTGGLPAGGSSSGGAAGGSGGGGGGGGGGVTIPVGTYLRSEFEAVGDTIFNLDDANEGSVVYSITAGNDEGHYSIDPSTGIVTIASVIEDAMGAVREDLLTVDVSGKKQTITVVDAYDWYVEHLPAGFVVLDEKGQQFQDPGSNWTAYNNLWGCGTAKPGSDFRMATIYAPDLPDGTVFLWDTPSQASAFGGAPVWSYMNVYWGNRYGGRTDLKGYPFRVGDIKSLTMDFEFEEPFGNDRFKIALNAFFYKEATLVPVNPHEGDFFLVLDQLGSYIPKYAHALPDVSIGNKPFAMLYNTAMDGGESRRVIIRDGDKLLSGSLDLKGLFDTFADAGGLDVNQYTPNFQIGIEVTSGFGAVRVKHLALNADIPGL